MSRGFTVGGLVILALIVVALAITVYMVSDYLYTAYVGGRYMADISDALTSLSRSCIAYMDNGTLYFPYGVNVEYSIPPNAVAPGHYWSIDLNSIRGVALIFTGGCVILVESRGNETGFEVIGHGAG